MDKCPKCGAGVMSTHGTGIDHIVKYLCGTRVDNYEIHQTRECERLAKSAIPEPPPVLKIHACDCGHTWETGQHGGHSCADNYRKRLRESNSEIARLKQKCNSLVTAAKISMVPAAMFMQLENVENENA